MEAASKMPFLSCVLVFVIQRYEQKRRTKLQKLFPSFVFKVGQFPSHDLLHLIILDVDIFSPFTVRVECVEA